MVVYYCHCFWQKNIFYCCLFSSRKPYQISYHDEIYIQLTFLIMGSDNDTKAFWCTFGCVYYDNESVLYKWLIYSKIKSYSVRSKFVIRISTVWNLYSTTWPRMYLSDAIQNVTQTVFTTGYNISIFKNSFQSSCLCNGPQERKNTCNHNITCYTCRPSE